MYFIYLELFLFYCNQTCSTNCQNYTALITYAKINLCLTNTFSPNPSTLNLWVYGERCTAHTQNAIRGAACIVAAVLSDLVNVDMAKHKYKEFIDHRFIKVIRNGKERIE